MKKNYRLNFKKVSAVLILLCALAVNLFAQTPQYYNYNTVIGTNYFPFGVVAGKQCQWLINPNELNQPSPAPAGNITKLYFMMGFTNGNATLTSLTIKLGQTALTSLPPGVIYTGTLDTVYYRASVNLVSTIGSWMMITLDEPFSYNPAQSLVVDISQCGATNNSVVICQTGLPPVRRNYINHLGGCSFAYSGQDGQMVHIGVDIATAPNCNFTWANQTSGTTSVLYSVKTVNDLVGWAVGGAGVIRKTTNGGTNWVDGDPNNGITADIYNVEAWDANTAWCTTSPSATFIYKTTNGGTNWVQVYTLASAFINAIKMVSATNGYAFGDPTGGNWLLLQTTNGGNNWSSLATVAGTGDGRNNCMQVALPNMWFGTGQGPIWRSTNSGINWSSSPSGITTQILGIHFNSANTGIAGGASAMKSTNGGSSWSPLTVLGTGNITGIQGNGASDYWYCRGTGVYRTTNDGTTWTQVHTAGGSLNDISIGTGTNGCLTGWTVGATGNVAKMTGTPVGISNNNNQIPENYVLAQNYPNPFNPVTTISFSIPKAGNVELKVFDVLGRQVAVIVNEFRQAGNYTVDFNAADLASGVYVYAINSGDFTDTKKMVLIK